MKTKILFLYLATLLLLASCHKDGGGEPCNCGNVTNDGVDSSCYWLELRNDCSGNKKKFCFDYNEWLNSDLGDSKCVWSEEPW